MNNVSIAGNLTKDPEVRAKPNGDPVLVFSIADNLSKTTPPIFWNCEFFGQRSTNIEPFLFKGAAVTVWGVIKAEEWTGKDGAPRKSMRVTVSDIALQGGRQDGGGQASQNHAPASYARAPMPPAARPAPPRPAPARQSSGFDDMPDDLPF